MPNPLKIASVVGARPQFIKLAPVACALERQRGRGGEPIEHLIIHTGQHYDTGMSDTFFADLNIPWATVNLGVGSGRHGSQTGQMLERIEQAFLETRPDVVVTYGDTNSTLAGTLAAAKLHLPVAHVEAGVRSFNRRMPEEINRIATDHVADLLLAPTPTAMAHLAREGLSDRALWTGDIMFDAVLLYRPIAESRSMILQRLALTPKRYGLVTIHRAENTDDATRLQRLLTALNDIAAYTMPLIFPLHPRTARVLRSLWPTWAPHPCLRLIEPLGYLDMLCLVGRARLILTDSGGVQREAFFLGRPCVTLRDETEWDETIQGGGNILSGVEPEAIQAAVSRWERWFAEGERPFASEVTAAFGNGHAAERIRQALLNVH